MNDAKSFTFPRNYKTEELSDEQRKKKPLVEWNLWNFVEEKLNISEKKLGGRIS